MNRRVPIERANKPIERTSGQVEALKAALAASQARAVAAEAKVSDAQAQIAALTLMIEKLRRALYGRRSERTERLVGQLELELDELSASATEDDLAAETAPGRTSQVKGFERRRPSRKPFPEHLPRERVVVPAPASCTCCGSTHLSKVGEDVTETLEVIPRRWKVIQTVREKFTCRDCEKLSQPPAPYHTVPRGWAGPNLLAAIVFEKYGQHQPLNRQSERYAREGVELSVSTLADQVGACAFALRPVHELRPLHSQYQERPAFLRMPGGRTFPTPGRPALRLKSRMQLSDVVKERQRGESPARRLRQRGIRRRFQAIANDGQLQHSREHCRHVHGVMSEGMNLAAVRFGLAPSLEHRRRSLAKSSSWYYDDEMVANRSGPCRHR